MKKLFVTLFLSFFSILLSAFDLVKDGESLVYIHLPENAGPVKTFAASELSAWIKAMTGASVPVSAGKRPGLLPVSYHLADEAGLAMNPDVKNAAESLKNQGFLLDAGPRGLRIIADDPRGITFGNYYLLRRYGGILFFHPDTEPYVPRTKNFSVPDGLTVKIPMRLRDMGLPPGNGAPATPEVREACALWNVRNGFPLKNYNPGKNPEEYVPGNYYTNGTIRKLGFVPYGQGGGHYSMGVCINRTPVDPAELNREVAAILKNERKLFSAKRKNILETVREIARFRLISRKHPEYYGLVDGKRVPTGIFCRKGDVYLGTSSMPCLSNPGTRRQLIENTLAFRNRHYAGMQYFHQICCDDQSQWCECPECMKLLKAKGDKAFPDKASDYYWDFVNAVAPGILKDPTVHLNVFVYRDYQAFPEKIRPVPHERMDITFAYHGRCYLHSITDPKCPLNRKFFAELQKWISIGMPVSTMEYANQTPGKSNYVFWEKAFVRDIRYFMKHDISIRSGGVGPWAAYATEDNYFRRNAAKSRWQIAWLCGHFMWDPDDDPDTVWETLFSRYYGKAWKPMREYRLLLEKAMLDTRQCMGYGSGGILFAEAGAMPGVLEKAKALLAEAEKIADDDPVLLKRILMDREYFRTNWLNAGISGDRINVARIPRAEKPIVPDGRLDEKEWLKALSLDRFLYVLNGNTPVMGTTALPAKTQVKFLYDDHSLYIGVECAAPPWGETEIAGDGSAFDAMKGSHLEIELTSPSLKGKYYHLAFSLNGHTYSALTMGGRRRDLNDRLPFEHKIRKTPSAWTLELRIDAKKLGGIRDGEFWKIDVGRFAPRKDTAYATLSGYGMHAPDFWPVFSFGDETLWISNGGFETQIPPPSSGSNGKNWIFQSETVPGNWIYQANGGTAETISKDAPEGKHLLRIKPPRKGYPAFLLQELSSAEAPEKGFLIKMKIRGRGSVEPYLVLNRTPGGQTSARIGNQKLHPAGEDCWKNVECGLENVPAGAKKLFLRITGEWIDLDDVRLVPIPQ